MSNLTSEQLAELTRLVNDRLDEFGGDFGHVTRGHVRLVHDAIQEYWEASSQAGAWPKPADPVQDDPLMDGYYACPGRIGLQRGREEAQHTNGHAEVNGDARPRVIKKSAFVGVRVDDAEHTHLQQIADEIGAKGNISAAVRHVIDKSPAVPVAPADLAALSGDWPAMPDLDGGQDLFAEHPVSGTPTNGEASAEDDDLVDSIPTPLDGLQIAPPKSDEKLTNTPASELEPHAASFDLIRSLAVDGIMPRQSDYDEAKAEDMPSSTRLKQLIGLTWGQLAAELGLSFLTPIERANLQRAEQAGQVAAPVAPIPLPRTLEEVDAEAQTASLSDASRERRVELQEKAFALLRGLAVDGVMPPISLYAARREEAGLPEARLLLAQLGCDDWGDLARAAGLRWNARVKARV